MTGRQKLPGRILPGRADKRRHRVTWVIVREWHVACSPKVWMSWEAPWH
jgi:hypothetical protein